MTTEEYQKLLPNSKFTPQSITDLAKLLLGVNLDLQKFRLVGFSDSRISASTLTAAPNQIFLILTAVGDGTIIFNGYEPCPLRYIYLEDYLCYEVSEVGGTTLNRIQYATFSWD